MLTARREGESVSWPAKTRARGANSQRFLMVTRWRENLSSGEKRAVDVIQKVSELLLRRELKQKSEQQN